VASKVWRKWQQGQEAENKVRRQRARSGAGSKVRGWQQGLKVWEVLDGELCVLLRMLEILEVICFALFFTLEVVGGRLCCWRCSLGKVVLLLTVEVGDILPLSRVTSMCIPSRWVLDLGKCHRRGWQGLGVAIRSGDGSKVWR
jgi:hypothetical protein